jgi:hypothetical protein
MRRFTGSIVMAFLTLLLAALPASAGHEWCEKDPIVRLNGTTVQILVAVQAENQHLVNGPIAVEIATPRGTLREILFTDDGFNGHGPALALAVAALLVAAKRCPLHTAPKTKVTLDTAVLFAAARGPASSAAAARATAARTTPIP